MRRPLTRNSLGGRIEGPVRRRSTVPAMPLPKITKRQVERNLREFCERRVPPEARDQVRLDFRFRGNSVTLYEERPSFPDPSTWVDIIVAKFRFDPKSKKWHLYSADRNSRWHEYLDTDPTPNFDRLLREVEEDPTGIFWG